MRDCYRGVGDRSEGMNEGTEKERLRVCESVCLCGGEERVGRGVKG